MRLGLQTADQTALLPCLLLLPTHPPPRRSRSLCCKSYCITLSSSANIPSFSLFAERWKVLELGERDRTEEECGNDIVQSWPLKCAQPIKPKITPQKKRNLCPAHIIKMCARLWPYLTTRWALPAPPSNVPSVAQKGGNRSSYFAQFARRKIAPGTHQV